MRANLKTINVDLLPRIISKRNLGKMSAENFTIEFRNMISSFCTIVRWEPMMY